MGKVEKNKVPLTNKKTNKKHTKKSDKKSNKMKKVLKWVIIIIAIFTALVYFMMSPLFNIRDIQVHGNEKVSTEQILSLSEINKGENIFAFYKPGALEKIKTNSYVEDVKIKRVLPNIIKISVEERIITYMLEIGGNFAYIDKQGFILELSSEKVSIPTLSGFVTNIENIKVGNRLDKQDLLKLNDVLKIMSYAETNNIDEIIIDINITDAEEYILKLEDEKIVYFGDISDLNRKMEYLQGILKETEGISGEMFLNGTGNNSNMYFREKV